MTTRETVKQLMSNKNITNAQMSSILGVSQATLWDRLNSSKNKSMSIRTLSQMLKILDYEVVIVPRNKANRIEGAYTLEE